MLSSIIFGFTFKCLGFPHGSDGKESACNAGYLGLIPGLGRSPGGADGNPLHYSGLENSMDRGAWLGYSPWGCKETDPTERVSLPHFSLLPKVDMYLFIS